MRPGEHRRESTGTPATARSQGQARPPRRRAEIRPVATGARRPALLPRVWTGVRAVSGEVRLASGARYAERDRIAAAKAERCQPAARAAIRKRVQQRDQHTGATGTNRMAKGNGAAIHVDLRRIKLKRVGISQ